MEEILFINACVRKESRTKELADIVLSKLQGNITEVNLEKEKLCALNANLLERRNELISKKDYGDPFFDKASQFAAADTIVIAAPFWDFSFPAMLKIYVENINVVGLLFRYTQEGKIQGLCKAKRVIYIATSGGPILNTDFGYGYIKYLCNNFYGIQNTCLITAQGLDIYGADIADIMQKAKAEAAQKTEQILKQ